MANMLGEACRLQSRGGEHVPYPHLRPRVPATTLNFRGVSPLGLLPLVPLPLEKVKES